MGGEGGGSVIVGLSTVAFVCWCRKGAEGCVEGRVRVVGGSPYAGGRQICGEKTVKKAACGDVGMEDPVLVMEEAGEVEKGMHMCMCMWEELVAHPRGGGENAYML